MYITLYIGVSRAWTCDQILNKNLMVSLYFLGAILDQKFVSGKNVKLRSVQKNGQIEKCSEKRSNWKVSVKRSNWKVSGKIKVKSKICPNKSQFENLSGQRSNWKFVRTKTKLKICPDKGQTENLSVQRLNWKDICLDKAQTENLPCRGQRLILGMLTCNTLPMTTPPQGLLVKALTFSIILNSFLLSCN